MSDTHISYKITRSGQKGYAVNGIEEKTSIRIKYCFGNFFQLMCVCILSGDLKVFIISDHQKTNKQKKGMKTTAKM